MKMLLQMFAGLPLALLLNGCATSQAVAPSKNHIVLVGHGMPATDYPKDRLREFFRMHAQSHTNEGHEHAHEHSHGHGYLDGVQDGPAEREREIREWPRTPENDPYKFAVETIAELLRRRTGHPVLVAFHEFCAPTVEQAVDRAVEEGAEGIVVITTMITPGGDHSEVDIPRSIEAARQRHPSTSMIYAWPYETDLLVGMFAGQIEAFETNRC